MPGRGVCVEGLLKQYAWVVNLAIVLGLAYFSAKITNVYLASLLEVPRSIAVVSQGEKVEFARGIEDFSSYDAIVERNIFDASEAPAPKPCATEDPRPECQAKEHTETVVARPTGEAVKTSLKLTVIATMTIGEGKDERSSATIDSGKGKGVDVYAVNDQEKTFAPGVFLVQVKPKRIEFINSGRLEYAELLDESGESIFQQPGDLAPAESTTASNANVESGGLPTGEQVKQVDGNKFIVNQAEIDAALSNLDQLYTQIRAVPNFKDGKVQGMKILSIKPGSVFAKLGLRRGDVLDKINGQQIDIKQGFKLFSELKEQTNFSLDLLRQGQSESYEYEIR